MNSTDSTLRGKVDGLVYRQQNGTGRGKKPRFDSAAQQAHTYASEVLPVPLRREMYPETRNRWQPAEIPK